MNEYENDARPSEGQTWEFNLILHVWILNIFAIIKV
jgi:hypothetical protein